MDDIVKIKLEHMEEKVDAICGQVDKLVKAFLVGNGERSMKDRIVYLEVKAEEHERWFEAIERKMKMWIKYPSFILGGGGLVTAAYFVIKFVQEIK